MGSVERTLMGYGLQVLHIIYGINDFSLESLKLKTLHGVYLKEDRYQEEREQ